MAELPRAIKWLDTDRVVSSCLRLRGFTWFHRVSQQLNDVECPSAPISLAAEYRRGMSWSFERLSRKWASLGLELVPNAQKQSFHELSNPAPACTQPNLPLHSFNRFVWMEF